MTPTVAAVLLAAVAGWFAVPRSVDVGRRLDAPAPAPAPRPPVSVVAARGRRSSDPSLAADTGELLAGLAAGLRTGAAPRAVLAQVATELPTLGALAAAARSPTGDVAAALAGLSASPGGRWLADLAVIWSVSEATGAPLADPVARLGAARRAQVALHRELAAQLTGPRATARLLALLPVAGLLLGSGLGGDPTGFLLASAPGRLCLVAGAGLVVAGLLWTRAIVRSALACAGLDDRPRPATR